MADELMVAFSILFVWGMGLITGVFSTLAVHNFLRRRARRMETI